MVAWRLSAERIHFSDVAEGRVRTTSEALERLSTVLARAALSYGSLADAQGSLAQVRPL